MPAKPLTHDRFLKGLQAGFDRMSQPKGSVSRASNILLTRRGALKVCDGSQIITRRNSGLASDFGPITEIFLYQPSGAAAGYYGIAKTPSGCDFYKFTTPTYSASNIIHTFPPTMLPQLGGGIGGGVGGSGSGGGGGAASSGFEGPTASGGVPGDLGPLPLILGFVNKMLLALGNGYPPYESDGSTATALTNTFSAVYPKWTPTTNFNVGDQVQIELVNAVFTATQGGTSGTNPPAFPSGQNQTVADNNIIWKNTALLTGSPAPPGAAHAEVYAGSYWVWNTWPTMTTDKLDGPSALRMSTLNNPNSWNPLNAAQIDPDDGDQGNGMKAFTVAEAGIAPRNFLMVFKFFSSYLIEGVFGASDFAITRLQTDLGCIASRTLQFITGFGIMRLTHLGFAVTDGINDRLQDPEAIRPYLFPETTESDIAPIDQTFLYFAKATQTANPPLYVCAVPLIRANVPVTPPPPSQESFSLSPAALDFGSVPANTLAQLLIEITYTGSGTATLDSVSLSNSQFELIQSTMPALPYTFNPGGFTGWYVGINQPAGSYSAVMTLVTSLGNYTVNLTANAVAGNVSISPSQLTFPNTQTGAHSAPQAIVVSNSEPVAVELGGYSFTSAPFTPSADFAFSPVPPFPMTIAPGQSLTFEVVAIPQTPGARQATLTILTNLAGVQAQMSLAVTGTGVGTFSLSPTALNFGSVPQGILAQLLIEITFTGTGPVTLNSVSLSNSEFQLLLMPALPYTFNGGDFTGWYVGLNQPAGSYSAVMTIVTSLSTLTVNVTGTTVVGTLVVSPTSLTFPSTVVGATSPSQAINVTNNEPSAVELGGYSIESAPFTPSTDFAFSPVPAFPMTIAPAQTLTFHVVATPTAAGARSATLTILTNLVGVDVKVTLAVNATAAVRQFRIPIEPRVLPPPPPPPRPPTTVSFSASPTDVTFGQVPPNVTLTLSLTVENMSSLVTNTGSFDNATLSNSQFRLVGLPAFPVVLGGGQSSTFQVTINQPAGSYSATLDLYFTESAAAGSVLLFRIPVTATVSAAPQTGSINVVPPSLDFGVQVVGVPTSPQTIHIINNLSGGLSLALDSPVMSNPAFQLLNPPNFPQFVANNISLPNTGLALQIVATASALGSQTGTLTFNTGNANFPHVVVNLTITGAAAPPVAVGDMTRVFCFDLVLKAWTVVDLPFSISAFKQFRTPGSQPITVMAGFHDSALRRWQAGDTDWDQGAANAGKSMVVHWGFTDAEVHTQGATVRMFHNQVIIRGDGGIPAISVTPAMNGYVQATVRAAMIALGDGQFEARARLLQAAQNVSLEVTGDGPAVIESIDYNVQPKPAGAALVFS